MRKLDILRHACRAITNNRQPQIPFEGFRNKGDLKAPELWDILIENDEEPRHVTSFGVPTTQFIRKPYTQVTFRHTGKDGKHYYKQYKLPYYPKLDNNKLDWFLDTNHIQAPCLVNIGFYNDKHRDETQFDLAEGEGKNEIRALWSEFCKENRIEENCVIYLNTAPVETETISAQ